MAVTFDELTKALLDGVNFPVVATVSPDGAPHSSVVWAQRDSDTVLFATARHQAKGCNLTNNPRISISLFNRDNPYQSVQIRGTTEFLDTDPERLINELAVKYTGEGQPPNNDGVDRVVVRVTPDKVTPFNG